MYSSSFQCCLQAFGNSQLFLRKPHTLTINVYRKQEVLYFLLTSFYHKLRFKVQANMNTRSEVLAYCTVLSFGRGQWRRTSWTRVAAGAEHQCSPWTVQSSGTVHSFSVYRAGTVGPHARSRSFRDDVSQNRAIKPKVSPRIQSYVFVDRYTPRGWSLINSKQNKDWWNNVVSFLGLNWKI